MEKILWPLIFLDIEGDGSNLFPLLKLKRKKVVCGKILFKFLKFQETYTNIMRPNEKLWSWFLTKKAVLYFLMKEINAFFIW